MRRTPTIRLPTKSLLQVSKRPACADIRADPSRPALTAVRAFAIHLTPNPDGEAAPATDGEGTKRKGHIYDPEKSRCLILDNENFDETLVTRGPLFIKFYDPGCSHCKKLMPTWEEVADKINPKEGEAPMFPMRIACIDCVANDEKCRQMPQMSGFPKFKLIGVDENQQADLIEYKGERTVEKMVEFAQTTSDIAEARKAQESEEDDAAKARRKNWIEAEPYFEKKALEFNRQDAGMKMLTWSNFPELHNATLADDAPANSHLVVVAHGSGAADTHWYDAWMDFAEKAHKTEGVNVIVAKVDCRNEMPRLCFDNEKFNFPERYDIFPIGMVFNKKFPDGDIDQAIHKHRDFQDVLKLLKDDAVAELLEKAAQSEKEMMDEL